MADLVEIGFVADVSGINGAERGLDRLANAGDRADKGVNRAASGIKSAFVGVAAAITGAVGAAVSLGELISTQREFDKLNAQLITATGSANNAADAFKAIQQFASQTPYDVNQVTESFTKLVNLGLTPSQKALMSYGNTASAMGKDLNQLIEAVADAATGEFERLKEFGIKAKQQGDQVSLTFQGVTKTIGNNSKEIEAYLMALGENEFAGTMENRMNSLDGAVSNFADTWNNLFLTISQSGTGDFIAESIRMATGAIQDLTDMIASGQLGAYFDAYIGKFKGFMDAGSTAFEMLAIGWDSLVGSIDGNAITGTFVNMPENIKAFVQIAVVELASLYDKAKIYLNPKNWVSDQSFDEMLAGINMVREESITQILAERESSIKSFDDQISAADKLRSAYEADKSAVIDLGQFAVDAGEKGADGIGKITDQMKAMAKAADDAAVDELFSFASDPFGDMTEEIKASNEEFQNYIDSIDEFGGAWTRTGSAVVDAVGSIIDVFDDYESRMIAITKAEEENARRKAETQDPAKLKKLYEVDTKLAKERTKAELANYRNMAGAAASFFKENSKERKALHALEMSLSAIELVMSAKKMIASAAAGAAKFFEQSGWGGFAGVAAMIATIGAIGGNIGGGGAGASAADIQQSQGTGSVLGSNDKSESIQNSFDNFSDIAVDQLVELRGIRENLAKFQGGIAQLSLGVSASGLADAKYINFANQYVGDIIDRGGLQTRGSRSQDVKGRAMLSPLQGQISDIFGFIQDSINSATGALEIAQANPAWAFISDIGKVSFKDMSAQEIEDELNAIFSQQADLITEFVVPAMKDYQQMGEGLFETLTRVAKEQAIFNDYMDKMGLSMQGVSSLMAIDMAQSIAAMMGGFENFTDAASNYVEKFFTEEEKFSMLQDSLTETFAALGVALPKTTQGFRDLIEGIDRTTTEGQRLFAALLEINPAVADYIEGLDRIGEATQDAANKAKAAADELVRAADEAAYKSMVASLKEQKTSIDKNLSDAEKALKKSFDVEKNAINDALNVRLSAIDAQNQAELDGIAERRSQAEAAASALRSASDSILAAYKSIGGGMTAQEAGKNISEALRLAFRGDFTGALNLSDSLSAISGGSFSSATDQSIFEARTAYALSTLGALTGRQASIEEQTLSQLMGAEESAKLRHQETIDLAKQEAADQIAKLDEQLNSLLGIDTTVLSLDDAIAQFTAAQEAADAFNYNAELQKLDIAKSQLGELQRINETLANQNIITQQQNNLAAEVIKLRESMETMQKEANDKLTGIARSTSASAQSLQNQEFANEVA